MAENRQARFLTGSTMRHVSVMTFTGMIGLTFLFLVDAATIFWVSYLDNETFMAALGFVWIVQLFMISTSLGFMIAGTALVAKSLGQGNLQNAREQATTSLVIGLSTQSVLALIITVFRYEILGLSGASGEVLKISADFLFISVPSSIFIVTGMISSAVLRAEGDAKRSMYVTLSAGIVAMAVDPFLIIGMDMGVYGAAWGVVISRAASCMLGLYFLIRIHNLAAPIQIHFLKRWAMPFLIIMLPAMITQLSSPFGNYLITRIMSEYGESAVAGWAVLGRLTVLTFGGVYSLSGAIGGIIGQNYGAHMFDRIRMVYRDALIFCVIYVVIAWAFLATMTGPIIAIFNLTDEAAEVIKSFTYLAAGSYIFAGALYVSNASFNNLGRPVYSSCINWFKDGVLMWPLCLLMGAYYAAPGVIYGQAMAWCVAGTVSMILGWYFIGNVEERDAAKARHKARKG